MSDPKTVDTVKTRVKHEGVDPLSAGVRLHNPSNDSDAKTYEVSDNEVDVVRPKGSVGGQAPMPVMPAHKVPNKSKLEQDKVAAGRVEVNGPDAHVEDTPVETEVDERSDKQIAADNAEREEALAKDRKTFGQSKTS